MNITIPMWTVLVSSIIAAVSITAAYCRGVLTGVKSEAATAFSSINKWLELMVSEKEKWQEERGRLMAQACVSGGKCRRTPDEYMQVLLDKIIEKERERQCEESVSASNIEAKDSVKSYRESTKLAAEQSIGHEGDGV